MKMRDQKQTAISDITLSPSSYLFDLLYHLSK